MEHIFLNLHYIQKNLELWQSKAEVYMEVDKAGDELVKDPQKSLSSLLVAINELFLKLEASIGHFHAMRQKSSVDESYSFPLILEKLPVVNQEESRWTDREIKDAINLIYQNLDKLDSYLSAIVVCNCTCVTHTHMGVRGLLICSDPILLLALFETIKQTVDSYIRLPFTESPGESLVTGCAIPVGLLASLCVHCGFCGTAV